MLERIKNAQEFERQQLEAQIKEDNLRSIRMQAEREEIMRNKQKLLKEIEMDQIMLKKDFRNHKRGALNSAELASKYGVSVQEQEEKIDLQKSSVSLANSSSKKGYRPNSRLCKKKSEIWPRGLNLMIFCFLVDLRLSLAV